MTKCPRLLPTFQLTFLLALLLSPLAAAQGATSSDVASKYDPLALFAPFDYPQSINRYRSADGMPGPDYWQNRADYAIHATLDPQAKTLGGDETITYTNNSPGALGYLWLQLDQNRYTTDARANFTGDEAPKPDEHTDGARIASVEVVADGKSQSAHYTVSDTRMRIDLPQPVAAHGGQVRVRIVWSQTVPGEFGGRTDWFATKNGDVFEMAQWYPRLCVYDDLHGWDTEPFLNNEFYLEYGNFDYRVTVPSDMLVVGSGELVNPQEVLTKTEQDRLAQARGSEKTIFIRTPQEVADPSPRPKQGDALTWHFRMDNTRDVSFGASKAYVWDAARIDLPSGKTALAMSAYPVESIEPKDGWQRSTEYVKATVEYFSKQLGVDYPWPNAIAEAGVAGGMEYPGIVFDWWKAQGKGLYGVTAHEFGHTWFPMIVGSDERRDAWMDEGFNTFVDVLAEDAFNHGEFAPKRDSEYAPKGGNPVDEIQSVLNGTDAPPILTRADAIREKYRHPLTYFKAALGLMLLRNQIIGPQLFDRAFAQYAQAWAFKHPSPSDFFRLMESASGEDLGWFWREWYQNNWKLDLAVVDVRYIDNDPAKGALVTVANLERMAMPATLLVNYADGSNVRVRVPVETWMQHTRFDMAVPGGKRIASATIDPDHALPDDDRGNNSYQVAVH